MKSRFFTLNFCYFLLINFALNAQSVNWLYLPDQNSWASKITLTADNEILQSRLDDSRVIAKLDSNGIFLWERSIWYEEEEFGASISAERPNKDLVHITRKGYIYLTDRNGQNDRFFQRILPDSIEVDFTGFIQQTEVIDNKIQIIGGLRIQDTLSSVRASLDLENLELEFSIIKEGISFVFDFTENGKRVELLSVNSDKYKIILFDELGNRVLEKQFPKPKDTYYEDIAFDANENIVLVGNIWKYPYAKGIITLFDQNGNLNWSKEYVAPQEEDVLFFDTVTRYKDKILVGGNIGLIHQYYSYVSSFDLEGNLAWDFRKSVKGRQDRISEIIVRSDDEILVTGTAGITDHPGPQRAYIMSLGNLISNVRVEFHKEVNMFPNPSSDYLQITGLEDIKHLEIYNATGQKVYQQTGGLPMNISTLDSGSYFVKIITEDFSFSKQWVKIAR